ncbi:hypothetical protein GP486_005248 [Trichoglossum hirsutum]|uniref:non-specific serine/threonine protein kinase n=1 Tax=Trichoglossum hirsutum TaxID=265104 RepID=A0A9P8RN48_9PEZI|nr:hypothetical protein GP486_005248 [Trichoglossum hirsutum]
MEDENTQPATQPVVDPRCVGGNSLGLDDEEVADIICILHPTTPDAQVAVQLTREHAPQHIITKPQFRVQQEEVEDGFEQDISEPTGHSVAQPTPHDPTVYSAAEGQPNRVLGRDIALKFSSQARLPKPGFIFGRGKRSDVLIANHHEVKRVSNAHFRIFLNSQGILMLEDMSTNGTFVDTHHLRRKTPNVNAQRMLVNSSIISVICGPGGNEVRFIVRIPVQTQAAEAMYKDKFNQYHLRFGNAGAKAGQGRPWTLTPLAQILDVNRYGPQFNGTATPVATRAPALSNFHQPSPFARWNGGEKYNILCEIGKGSFATVYKIATKSSGDVFAAKQVSRNGLAKGGTPGRVENEIDIIKEMNHPNIVRYIECYSIDDHIIIVMEYMEYGDLTGYLNKHGALPELMVQEIARQILRGLEYVHQKMVTHRDIKPDNILIQSIDPLIVKLSDFGLSKRVDDSTFLKTFCGTLLYCAPEVYHERTNEKPPRKPLGDRYGQSADMWSFGAVLFMLLCNKPPFAGKTQPESMLTFITNEPLDVRPLREHGISARGIAFVKKLLNIRSELRPTETECLEDPWLKDGDDPSDDMDMPGVEPIDQDEDEGNADDDLGASSQVSQLRLSPGIEDRVIADSTKEDSQESGDVKRRDFAVATRPQEEIPSSIWSSDGLEPYGDLVPHRTTGRLFGEISGSLARSSEVLALPNRDSGGDKINVQLNLKMPHKEHPNGSPRQDQDEPHAPQSSSSLQGTESLVNRLQMSGSPSPENSLVPTPNSPRTPTTPKSRFATPTSIVARPREEDEAEDIEPTPKRQKFDRKIRLIPPSSVYRDAAHDASESRLVSENGDDNGEPVAPREERGVSASAPLLDTPVGDSLRGQVTNASGNAEPQDAVEGGTTDISPVVVGAAGTDPKGDGFVRPLPVWGKLIPKLGSDPNVSLSLTKDLTSYGRSEWSNFVVSADKTLISKRHFIIQLFRSGLTSEDIKAAGKTWMDYPEMRPIIKVLSRNGMWINNRRIEQNQYARVYNGDELTVYADPFRHKVNGKHLIFVCDFYPENLREHRPGYPLFQNDEMNNFAEDGRNQFPDLSDDDDARGVADTMIPVERIDDSAAVSAS